jgi:hypothetical protein
MTVFENIISTKLVLDLAGARASIDKYSAGFKQFIDNNKTAGQLVENFIKKVAGTNPAALLAAGGLAAMTTAAVAASKQAIALADALTVVSQRTGQSVESLSVLKFAAEQSNVSFGEVQSGLRALTRTTAAAANGNKAAGAAFKKLNIDIRNANGGLKSSEQLFREVADGVASIQDPTLKAAAAAGVLGRQAGPALVPLLTQGTAGLDAFGKEAAELGIVIGPKFARDADDFGDNLQKLSGLTVGFGQAIASELLPGINALLEAFIKAGKVVLRGTVLLFQDLGFATFKLAGVLGVATAAAKLFFAQMVNDKKAIAQAKQELGGYTEALQTTREEWLEMRQASPEEEIKGTGKAALTATEALDALVDSFSEVDKAIGPVVALARDLAGTMPELSPRFQELVTGLRGIADTGPEAAKALQEVLAVAAQAQLELSNELAQSFRDLTGSVDALPRRRGELRQGGVQGPLTQEQAAGIGDPLRASGGIETEPLQEAPALVEETATSAEKLSAALLAADLAAEEMNTTLGQGNAILNGLTTIASGFGDALLDTALGAKLAFQGFFKQLLKDLARAIIRATILQAILAVFSGGFSLAKIGKAVQQSLGFVGFQDRESSILGRAAQASSLSAGVGVAPVAAAAAAPGVTVQIHEPGPFTWAEATDRKVLPRLRERQRKLNEQSL